GTEACQGPLLQPIPTLGQALSRSGRQTSSAPPSGYSGLPYTQQPSRLPASAPITTPVALAELDGLKKTWRVSGSLGSGAAHFQPPPAFGRFSRLETQLSASLGLCASRGLIPASPLSSFSSWY